MEGGNRLAGFESSRGYHAIWLYPIGLEIFNAREINVFEISLIFHPFSISLSLKSNQTLFRNE